MISDQKGDCSLTGTLVTKSSVGSPFVASLEATPTKFTYCSEQRRVH